MKLLLLLLILSQVGCMAVLQTSGDALKGVGDGLQRAGQTKPPVHCTSDYSGGMYCQ